MQEKVNNKGITLIALVITIVVLLILAGVSINFIIKDGGIIDKAKEAAEKAEIAQKDEEEELSMIDKIIDSNVNSSNSMCNPPELKNGMIPVKWDNDKKVWVKADKTNNNKEWYNYDIKQWANVVTVNSKSRNNYMNASVNTEIPMKDITTMFVWIPRYAYKIEESKMHTNKAGNIEIKWLIGTSNRDYYGNEIKRDIKDNGTSKTTAKEFVIHPAFTDTSKIKTIDLGGVGKEISGFWVGKFESSNSTTPEFNEGINSNSSSELKLGHGTNNNASINIKPNKTAWRNISAIDIYVN